MSRREIGCSARGMTLGSTIERHCTRQPPRSPVLRSGPMCRTVVAVGVLCLSASLGFAADAKDPLARARQLYNERLFQEAIAAAEEAGKVAERADSADLIAARAYLERFRESAAPEDLDNARGRLRRINPERLGPRERSELIIGLGEGLYFDGAAGAAAGVFESVLDGAALTPAARERVLDWWASALDKDA